jgi:hypothetical protein
MAAEHPYGWQAFDPEVVDGIRARLDDFVRSGEDGGLRCPLVGHSDWLPWDQEGSKGTVWHSAPPLRFHRSGPTYVLQDAADNFIAGNALIGEALRGEWGKAETGRLGHEHSEDAVTWNVFRSLQEAGSLAVAMRALAGIEPRAEPHLHLWGRRIGIDETRAWDELARARNEIEPWGRLQTEPDCCLHVPGQALALIEAKFGSPMTSKASDVARDAWLDRYEGTSPGVLNRTAIEVMAHGGFPEQILRNVMLALQLAQHGEEAVVIALVRHKETRAVHDLARTCLVAGVPITVREESWESLYKAFHLDSALAALARYMRGKSFRLRPAFDI